VTGEDGNAPTQQKRKLQQAEESGENIPERKRAESKGDVGNTSTSQPVDQDEANDENQAMLYRISSRHLISASPKSRSELTQWSESVKGDDSPYHISTSEWDPEALSIVLNVMHLRHRRVPKELKLVLLAKSAVLVDYYRCWETFDLISDLWVKHIRRAQSLGGTYCQSTMLWLLVSWVFKLPTEFESATRYVMRKNEEPHIRDMEPGTPIVIISMIP
jgi:hypothetical protein